MHSHKPVTRCATTQNYCSTTTIHLQLLFSQFTGKEVSLKTMLALFSTIIHANCQEYIFRKALYIREEVCKKGMADLEVRAGVQLQPQGVC